MSDRKYSVIVFDLGNVLLPFDYGSALQKLENIETGLGEIFRNYYTSNYRLHRDFERGDISENYFVKTMLRALDNKISSETFISLYSDIFTENSGATALLPVLKNNYQLVLLSNTNSLHMQYGWKNFHFLNNFSKLILSHQVNSVKPEEKIYRAVEEFTNKPPEEHFFIDDVQEYVDAARTLGWDGMRFTDNAELIQQLRQKNIF